ncbi:hypothetical protein GCM10027405_23130 [Arthrobacter alkaliphilus]|uniref:DUF6318 family protein n=1 Tax=Arthrobacter alkaliphilus TaxID=369936 RepID=UPI001F15B0EB|nr:DUF6318 family protein [Arthrobacter alkaliphilus]
MTPRTSVSARSFVIGSLAAALTLTACENTTQPQSDKSAPATVTASATPTPTATPTAVYKPADAKGKAENVPLPVLPEAAKANSKEGVEAFARYWFQVMSYAYETGDVGPLGKITGPNCEMCEGVVKVVPKAYSGDRWVSGGVISTPSVSSTFKPQPDQSIPVVVQVIQSKIHYWSSGGTEYRQPTEATNTGNVAFLRFVEGAWRLDGLNPLQ